MFISNSQLAAEEVEKLQNRGLIHHFIQRENAGFDFAAWRDGMAFVGFEELKDYDSVTLMNDTCFGPLWDLQEQYDKFESDPEVEESPFRSHLQMLRKLFCSHWFPA